MNTNLIKLFLRLSISASFLSAVADRFGWYPTEISAWGNWQSFVEYTSYLNPWAPDVLISFLATAATFLEIVFGICLLIGFKTEWVARFSGILLLIFGLSMTFTSGMKAPLDYSVFTASAACFALSLLNRKFFEIDLLFNNSQ